MCPTAGYTDVTMRLEPSGPLNPPKRGKKGVAMENQGRHLSNFTITLEGSILKQGHSCGKWLANTIQSNRNPCTHVTMGILTRTSYINET